MAGGRILRLRPKEVLGKSQQQVPGVTVFAEVRADVEIRKRDYRPGPGEKERNAAASSDDVHNRAGAVEAKSLPFPWQIQKAH
jgi:hypothetical protein